MLDTYFPLKFSVYLGGILYATTQDLDAYI